MDYVKGNHRFQRITGLSALDVSMVLDETALDGESGLYEDVPVSAVTVVDGYSIGSEGELSLDPATARATQSLYESDSVSPAAHLKVGDYVESNYDGVLDFSGIVREVNVEVSPSYDAVRTGNLWHKQITYSLSSLELVLLSQVASWEYLPAESALTRLSRWFSVDISQVAATRLPRFSIEMEAVEEGSATLLDLLRAFSAATMIPLRMAAYRGPYFLEAFDTSQAWDDQPLVPVAGFTDSHEWATSVGFSSSLAHPTPLPVRLSVRTDDMRLLGGVTSSPLGEAALDTNFLLDSSRLDAITSQAVGFRAPMPIEAFGWVLPVLRVTQTFGEHYEASIEIDPASSAGVSPMPVPTDEPTPVPAEVQPTPTLAPVMPNGEWASIFDGFGDFCEAIDSNIFSISNTGQLTWEAWIRPDTLEFARTEQTGYVHWMGKGTLDAQEWAARMYSLTTVDVPSRSSRISAYAYNLAGGLGAGHFFQDELKAGEWIHVVGTYNVAADRIRIYRDGVLRGESTFSSYSIVPANGTAPLRVGTQTGNSFFKGAIGKVAIYNRELAGPDIEKHHRAMLDRSTGYDAMIIDDTPAAYWAMGSNLTEQMGTGRSMVRYRATSPGYNVLIDSGPYGLRVLNGDATPFTADHLGNVTASGKMAINSGASSSAQMTVASPTAGHTAYHGQVANTAGNIIRGLVAGDSTYRVIVGTDRISFGPGTSTVDTSLYRASANLLKTDDSLEVSGDVSATDVNAANRVYLGASLDASIYRGAGGVVRTSGALLVGKYTTATRPSASTVGQGAMIYDVDINRPIFSDGTTWRNAAGTAV